MIEKAELGDRFILPLAGEEHIVRVAGIVNGTYVKIIISSDPIEDTIFLGQTKVYDINLDGRLDLAVTLVSITDGKAMLKFADPYAAQPAQPTAGTGTEVPQLPELPQFSNETLAAIGVIALAMAWFVLYPVFSAKRKVKVVRKKEVEKIIVKPPASRARHK